MEVRFLRAQNFYRFTVTDRTPDFYRFRWLGTGKLLPFYHRHKQCEMKVAELKEELEARNEAKSGNKVWLRRRLHAAIVRDYLQRCRDEMDES